VSDHTTAISILMGNLHVATYTVHISDAQRKKPYSRRRSQCSHLVRTLDDLAQIQKVYEISQNKY